MWLDRWTSGVRVMVRLKGRFLVKASGSLLRLALANSRCPEFAARSNAGHRKHATHRRAWLRFMVELEHTHGLCEHKQADDATACKVFGLITNELYRFE